MSGFVLSNEAQGNLFEIWTYLFAEVETDFANKIEDSLFTEFK